MRRMELSKDKLFEKLVTTVNDQMKRYPEDDYLKDIFSSLKNKSSSSFGKKSDLVNVISLLDQYMYDLKVGTDYDDLLDLDSDDEVQDRTLKLKSLTTLPNKLLLDCFYFTLKINAKMFSDRRATLI